MLRQHCSGVQFRPPCLAQNVLIAGQLDEPSSSILLALGMTFQGTTGLIGFNCNPITTGGISDPTCEQSPVCCENNNVVSRFCLPS